MDVKKINWALYKAFKDKGYTGKELCKKTGIDYHRFSRLINGQLKKWRKDEMRILSKVLRVPQKELFK